MPTDPRARLGRRKTLALSGAAVASLPASLGDAAAQGPKAPPLDIQGIVWQPDYATIDPRGNWDKLCARTLLVQWTVIDGMAYVLSPGLKPAQKIPDWTRIGREPWAQDVILGLATLYDDKQARRSLWDLFEQSRQVLDLATPLKVTGWYFPVEVDPTWVRARMLAPLLNRLPKPLWISLYDNTNIGAGFLAEWLTDWLPPDVGVFFQDGVGNHVRDARTARVFADALADALGKQRLRIIAEAVRPKGEGRGWRPATVEELQAQLTAYAGYEVFLFEGPHYIDDAMVCGLAALGGQRC